MNVPPTLDTITDPVANFAECRATDGQPDRHRDRRRDADARGDGDIRQSALLADPTVTYASPNATGTLTYTPVAGQHGTALVTVTINDGLNTTTRTFTVTVKLVSNQTYTVGTTSDTSSAASVTDCTTAANTTCRLRDALGFATSGTDTVVFNDTGRGTIVLTSTLTLGASVKISGPTSGTGVTVSGGWGRRLRHQ